MGIGDQSWTQSAADHVTEREAGSWVDCVPASGVEFARAGANDRAIPATAAEREALRAAMGLAPDHGGATLAQLSAGLEARYGFTAQVITRSWADLAGHVARAGTVAVVTGRYGALPAHFRRWDPTFSGAHAVAVYGQGGTLSPWWCDPLAPTGAYRGEPITTSALRSYFEGYTGAGALLADVGGLTRDEMAIHYALARWNAPANAAFYDTPNGAKIGALSKAVEITSMGIPMDRSSDGLDYSWRAVIVVTGAMTGTLAPKVVYMRRVDLGTEIATDKAWDAYCLSALRNPDSFKPETKTVTLAVEGAVVATVEV